MRSALFALALAGATAAWEVTFYDEQNCNQGSGFNYYVLTGSDDSCYALGDAPGSTMTCGYYSNGGQNGPDDCAGHFTKSSSFVISGGDCYFSTVGNDCGGSGFGSTETVCQNQGVRSFSCMAGT